MSKKSEKKNQVVEAAEEKEVTPVAKQPQPVQLTPIIQPIAFVPYSTQDQPLYTYEEEEEVENVEPGEIVEEPKKKKVSCAAIFLSIFSLIIVAVCVIAKFVALPIDLTCINGLSGLDVILDLVNNFDVSNIAGIAIAVSAVMAVLTLLASLIRITKKGACVVAKITTFIGLVGAIAAVLLALINDITVGYGLYAVAVLSLVNVLIAYLAKND